MTRGPSAADLPPAGPPVAAEPAADGSGLAAAVALIDALLAGRPAQRRLVGDLLATVLAERAPVPRREDDGRRTSPLTPDGYPVEASLSITRDQPTAGDGAVRWSATPGTRHRFFAERLLALRRAGEAVGALVDEPLRRAWTATARLLDAAFPEPARVPVRTGLVGAIGVAAAGDGRLGLRLYVNVGAAPGALERAVAADPDLAPAAAAASPHPVQLVAVEVGADGALSRRCYAIVPAVAGAADPATADRLGPVLAAAGLPEAALKVPAVLATDGVVSAVHLSARSWQAAGVPVEVAVERLAALLPSGPAVLAAWRAALSHTAPLAWRWTVTGLLAGERELDKLNAYLAPAGPTPSSPG